MPDQTITTPRLTLRRFTPDDAPALHAIMRDPGTMRYWSTLPHATLAETADFIARTLEACRSGESDDFAAIHEGMPIGKAGLWRGNELGFIFSRSVWGTGLAREAIDAVIARGFARGHKTIWADVDPRNAHALALLDRLGFVKTGEAQRTFQLGQEWADSVYLELRAPV